MTLTVRVVVRIKCLSLYYVGVGVEALALFSRVFEVVSARGKLLAFMNAAFFFCVFVVFFVSEFLLPSLPYEGLNPPFPEIINAGFPLMLLEIFAFNLGLSAFVFVTLPGFAFFPFSTGFLLYRASIWGVLLHYQPTWLFLIAMPTLVFEGEAYVFAAVAGTVVGGSWLKPKWFTNRSDVKRVESLTKSLKECLAMYLLVAIFLLVAATIEAITVVTMFQ